MAEQAAQGRSLSFSTEAIDTDKCKELSCHIRNKSFKMRKTVFLPAKSPRYSTTDYAGDTHLYISFCIRISSTMSSNEKIKHIHYGPNKKLFMTVATGSTSGL